MNLAELIICAVVIGFIVISVIFLMIEYWKKIVAIVGVIIILAIIIAILIFISFIEIPI